MNLAKNILSITLVYLLALSQPFAKTPSSELNVYQLAKIAADHNGIKIVPQLLEEPITAETYGTAIGILKDSKNPVKIKLARATLEHINKFSVNALYRPQAEPFKHAKARFPVETMIFYGAIFAAAVLQGNFSSDPMNPVALEILKETLSDPIGYLGFFSFIMMSTATSASMGRMLPLLAQLGDEYAKEIAQDIKTVSEAKPSANKFSRARFDQAANRIENPTFKFKGSNILGRATVMAMGPLAMSMGMMASTQVEQLFHDEKINLCAASWMSFIKGQNQMFAGNESQDQGICQKAFSHWFTKDKLERMWPGMVGMVLSSTLAHMILGGSLGVLKKLASKNQATNLVFKGLEVVMSRQYGAAFQGLEKVPGLKWMAPFRFSWGGLIFQFGSLVLFMTIEEVLMSEWFTIPVTDWVARNQIQRHGLGLEKNLQILRTKTWNDKADSKKTPCYAEECAAKPTMFFEQLDDLSETLFSYRQNLLAKAMMANQNWLKYTQNFVATYQGAHRVYDKFIFELDNKNAPNAFVTRDYLANVKVQIPGLPHTMAVPTIKSEIAEGLPYKDYMAQVRGDLNEYGVDALLREERFKTIVRAVDQIDHWLEKQKDAVNRDDLLVIKNYFRFADKSRDIEKLFREQIEFTEGRLKKSKGDLQKYLKKEVAAYNKALEEYKIVLGKKNEADKIVWEYNSRGSQVSRGLGLIQGHLIDLVYKSGARSQEEVIMYMSNLPKNNVYVILRDLVGSVSASADPGEQVLMELAGDKDAFDPETEGLHPKSINLAKTPSMVEYLAISMACGPELHYNGALRLFDEMSLSDAMKEVQQKTNLIQRNAHDKMFFTPPRIVDTKNEATICAYRYTNGKPLDILTDQIRVDDEQGNPRYYRGLFNYLREFVRPELKGKTGKERNFDIWWDKHIGSLTRDMFVYLRGHYRNLLDKHYFSAISNDDIVPNGLGDMPLASAVVENILQETQMYLAMMYLNFKDSSYFDSVNNLKTTLGLLCNNGLFEKDWAVFQRSLKPPVNGVLKAKDVNVDISHMVFSNLPKSVDESELEFTKAFFGEVQGRFENSRNIIRKFRSVHVIEDVRKLVDEFKKNQKDLEDQLNKYAAIHFGAGLTSETAIGLPKTKVGDPKYYLEVGIRRLFDLHKEINTYGRMAGLMAIAFYDLQPK